MGVGLGPLKSFVLPGVPEYQIGTPPPAKHGVETQISSTSTWINGDIVFLFIIFVSLLQFGFFGPELPLERGKFPKKG